MSIHQKQNGTWYVQYRSEGKLHREYTSVGEAGRLEAELRNAEVSYLKAQGIDPASSSKGSLKKLTDDYLLERKITGASERWLDEFKHLLDKYILPALGRIPLEKIKYQHIIEMMNARWGGCKLSTRQRYMGYLKAVFSFGVEHEYCKNNPLGKWRKSKEPKLDLELTFHGLQKIIAHAAPHLAWAIKVEWQLGARPGPSELFKLKWSDIDYAGNRIKIKGTKTHSSHRTVPITEDFKTDLQMVQKKSKSAYIINYRGKPVKRMQKALKGACQRAKLPYHVTMYDIRHLFATTLLAKGSDLKAVSELLGHTSIATTQIYIHLIEGEKRRAISTLPAL